MVSPARRDLRRMHKNHTSPGVKKTISGVNGRDRNPVHSTNSVSRLDRKSNTGSFVKNSSGFDSETVTSFFAWGETTVLIQLRGNDMTRVDAVVPIFLAHSSLGSFAILHTVGKDVGANSTFARRADFREQLSVDLCYPGFPVGNKGLFHERDSRIRIRTR